MKFFAILLCIAIGSVFGELERRQFAKGKLEITEDDNKASSLASVDDDRKIANSSDESLELFLDKMAAGTKETDSVEQITSRKSSPVKPSYSKAVEVNLEKMRLGKVAKSFKELRETTRPNNTESKTSKEISVNFLNRMLMNTDAFGRNDRNPESNSRKHLRTKRSGPIPDPDDAVQSFKTYKLYRDPLTIGLRTKMQKTDVAEIKLLESYAASKGDTKKRLADYNKARKAERKQLTIDATYGIQIRYLQLRKGTPWNFIKLRPKFKEFFGKPSPALTEYEKLKKDELIWMNNLLGRPNEPPQEKEEDETVEEMKRGVRVKEAEVEYDAHRENNVQCVNATSDANAKGHVDVYGSTDNVTETTTETKAKDDSSNLLRYLILFAMIMQVIIAILILGPQRDKLAEWCRRKEKAKKAAGPEETDPLQVGEKVFVTGSDCKISISSQRRHDEADENQ